MHFTSLSAVSSTPGLCKQEPEEGVVDPVRNVREWCLYMTTVLAVEEGTLDGDESCVQAIGCMYRRLGHLQCIRKTAAQVLYQCILRSPVHLRSRAPSTMLRYRHLSLRRQQSRPPSCRRIHMPRQVVLYRNSRNCRRAVAAQAALPSPLSSSELYLLASS